MGCEKYKKQSGNIVTLPTYSSSYFLSNHVSLRPTSDKRNVLCSWFLAITLYSIIIELSIKNLYIFCKKKKKLDFEMDFNNPVIIQCRKYRIFRWCVHASCWVEWIHLVKFFLYIHRFIFEQEIIPKETALQKILISTLKAGLFCRIFTYLIPFNKRS